MSIEWEKLPDPIKRQQLYMALKSIITPERYNKGEWTLTEVITSRDRRSRKVLELLDGLDINGKRTGGAIAPRIDFRFQVLSRQACCKDKNGKKIWFKTASLENSETDDDIVAKPDDPPQPGDVVEWKGVKKEIDENGIPVDSRILRRWAYMGIRPEEFIEFVVDSDGCITVPYPYAYSMLSKFGRRISKPKFRRKSQRSITNWFFAEAPPNFKTRKPRTPKPKPDDVPDDGPLTPALA